MEAALKHTTTRACVANNQVSKRDGVSDEVQRVRVAHERNYETSRGRKSKPHERRRRRTQNKESWVRWVRRRGVGGRRSRKETQPTKPRKPKFDPKNADFILMKIVRGTAGVIGAGAAIKAARERPEQRAPIANRSGCARRERVVAADKAGQRARPRAHGAHSSISAHS